MGLALPADYFKTGDPWKATQVSRGHAGLPRDSRSAKDQIVGSNENTALRQPGP